MSWGEIELHPEVEDWLRSLSTADFQHVARYVELLAERGPLLDEPHTRQLRGKLRELRFNLGGQPYRISYWISPGRRIALLTVFRKTQRQERAEISRAWRTMERCVEEGHTAEDEEA